MGHEGKSRGIGPGANLEQAPAIAKRLDLLGARRRMQWARSRVAISTSVGVYALLRMFTLVFVHDPQCTHRLILVIAGVTMITGVLGAVAQNEFRRILSFHIINQIGYMIMGLGIFTPFALAASIFYVPHHIIVKARTVLYQRHRPSHPHGRFNSTGASTMRVTVPQSVQSSRPAREIGS
jgi:hypothetical protein